MDHFMPTKDPEKCREIRDAVDKWEKYWTINRSLYYEWIDFVMGDQWREDESKLFETYNKIPLMFNKLGVLRNHLVGDIMQNTPNLQIMPDQGIDADTANVRAALIKNIALNSDTKTIFQTAFGLSVVAGYSGFHGYIDYKNNKSFDQEIKAGILNDSNQYYWDISAKHPCKVDGMRGGYKTRLSRKWFRDKWGKDIESQIGTAATTEDSTMAFADDDSITQIDDFEREGKNSTLYLLSDRSTMSSEEFNKLETTKVMGKKAKLKNGFVVTKLKEREIVKYKIIHRQVAGDFILAQTDMPGEIIPVFFVDQQSYYTKQGQQITRSFFKDVKDAQKYLNYLATQSAHIMKISRYDQFIMPRKCAASPDAQQQWRDPSVVNGALYYDETPSGAKPEKLEPPELSRSLTEQYQRTLVDIQSGTGMFNTQLGEMGNEVSGSAIEKRTQRGTKNTQSPRTSLDKAIATFGEWVNQVIPKVYDAEQTLTLSMPESESMPVEINKQMDEYGIQIKNDMTTGEYKIRIKPGLSYEGQKQEGLESLQLVLNADKSGQVFPMIADLYAENLPLDNNIEIRNRLRTIVSPEIIEAGKTGKPLPPKQPQPSPDQIMAQLKQAEMQHKAQEAQMNYQAKMRELSIKESEIQRKALETHQNMTIEFERLQAEKEEAAAELQETLLRNEVEHKRIDTDLQMHHGESLIKLLTHNPKKTESRASH